MAKPRSKSEITPNEPEYLMAVYAQYSAGWRHYNGSIWQIPAVAMAMNTLLVGTALDERLASDEWAGVILIVLAILLTFVLMIASWKHFVHQRFNYENKKMLEKLLCTLTSHYKTTRPLEQKTRELLEDEPGWLVFLASQRAHIWLARAMVATIGFDAFFLGRLIWSLVYG